jgi:hypothetical protein
MQRTWKELVRTSVILSMGGRVGVLSACPKGGLMIPIRKAEGGCCRVSWERTWGMRGNLDIG